MKHALAAAVLGVLLGGGSAGAAEDDDLAVVKKAVAQSEAVTSPAAKGPVAKAQWLKIRVHEKTGNKVTVNLPLALVRAVGNDWPMFFRCGSDDERGRPCGLKISEVLAQLDAGQSLVEVHEDGGDTVRIWVE